MIFYAEIIRCNIASNIPKFLLTTDRNEAYNHNDTVVLVMTCHETKTEFINIVNYRKEKNI